MLKFWQNHLSLHLLIIFQGRIDAHRFRFPAYRHRPTYILRVLASGAFAPVTFKDIFWKRLSWREPTALALTFLLTPFQKLKVSRRSCSDNLGR